MAGTVCATIPLMPSTARRLIRKMRGGAQAHLLETDDGFWVVKFLGNPQHRRVLVNEWIASVVLRYLQIASPETALIEVTEDFLRENPEVGLQFGGKRVPVEPGRHFGSRYPGDPALTAVYDFVPDALLSQVMNISDFAACLVFDKWMGNVDTRQSVFFRALIKDWLPESEAHPLKRGFVTQMIDHGFVLNGPHWDFPDTPIQGLYHRRSVYGGVKSMESFEPWIERVLHFPEHVLDKAMRQTPAEWVAGEESQLTRVLERLLDRRRRVRDLIEDTRKSDAGPFVNWG